MRIVLRDLRLKAESDGAEACALAKRQLNKAVGKGNYGEVSVYRSSVDARHPDRVTKVYSVACTLYGEVGENTLKALNASVLEEGGLDVSYGSEVSLHPPVIVGFGPAGMLCGLLLAEHGYRPIVLERGSDVSERTEAVTLFREKGILDTENNVQFGAGGAGTFSDGKLVTRINDKKCRFVLETYRRFGAPESVLTEAKPHIGTDNLGRIVTGLKNRIIECGGQVLFNTRFEGSRRTADGLEITTSKGSLAASALVLATGHSARDTYRLLHESGVVLQPKAFSVGVRIEQLREEINRAMYGRYAEVLGNAEYNFSYRQGERAVYTFCMCPGGHVVEAASEENTVVVNGMSNYSRDGKNSNSALVVSVLPEDCGNGLFDGMSFQRGLERRAFEMGGSNYGAPVQTVGDYIEGKKGTPFTRITPTYADGNRYNLTDLNGLFPGFVNSFLKEGLVRFERKLKGFAPIDGVLTGAETRTSSPLRILRGENLTSPSDDRIYPCGEGAGYAGGITSASVDGIRVALSIMERFKPLG